MSDVYTVQYWWEWLIAAYLFLGGMGGGGMMVSYYFCCRKSEQKLAAISAITSLIIVIVGVFFLILDLEKPEKFYLVFMSPHLNTRSMIFVGSSILTAFIIFGLIYITSLEVKWPSLLGRIIPVLPWYGRGSVANLTGLLAAIAGFLTTFYTGVLIGILKSVPFWHTPALPLLFVASALSTGVVGILLVNDIYGFTRPKEERHRYEEYCSILGKWDAILISIELLIVFTYLFIFSYGPREAELSVQLLTAGELAPYFIGGVILMGLSIPLLLEYWHIMSENRGRRASCAIPMVAAILVIVGGLILRYVILQSGVMTIFLPPS
ncbi:MAG: polysulfide reductase NrfD [Candidatus Korarchaeota archaeon]|nr:polysulfide reductase NrfD [Candidatus Korarchaeota archaeon]